MPDIQYDDFLRKRITELRLKKDISEHKMSLELGRSGSYIRSITSGAALPSLKEFFNIIDYFDMTPSSFFSPLDDDGSLCHKLCEQLKTLDDADLEKVDNFISWIDK